MAGPEAGNGLRAPNPAGATLCGHESGKGWPRMQATGKGAGGFTLLELMVVLALSALVAGWAVTGLRDFWLGLRVKVASQHFLTVLETARYQTLVAPVAVTICATRDGHACDRDRGHRLLVFIDADEDGVWDEGERLQAQEQLFEEDATWLVWRAFQSKPYLRWGRGRTDSMNGTFTVCNSRRKDAWLRQMVVNRVGRTRTVLPAVAGGNTLLAARRVCGW